jgi:flavin reductase (DIM6/NTAB) family NADH-FMN oxidoreductase RutF
MPRVSLDPSELSPGQRYRLLVDSIIPRPIAFVSTLSAAGIPNLAPFSYFMVGGAEPMSVAFSPSRRSDGTEKDTLRNVRETGEYSISLVTRAMAEGMNAASAEFAPDETEWESTPFTANDNEVVKPKRVAQSPVSFECKLFQLIAHGDQPASANYVIGEVVRVHLEGELAEFKPIARLGGGWYLDLDIPALFSMPRPSAKLDRP